LIFFPIFCLVARHPDLLVVKESVIKLTWRHNASPVTLDVAEHAALTSVDLFE